MTKTERICGRLAIIRSVFAALVLLLAVPLISHAQILEAGLQVNGMSCPFCAFGIEKKLRRVEGVHEVDVLLDEGRVVLTFRASNAATVGALEEAVASAGFQLSGIDLKARGILTTEDSTPVLDAGAGVRFWLLEADNGRMKPLSPETLESLGSTAANGMLIVTGIVHTHVDGPPSLLVLGADAGGPQ